jgi:hypothetical protein
MTSWLLHDPRSTFRSTPAICLKCVESDLLVNKFAYYRRTHLVKAVTYCATHRSPLLEMCPACGAPFSHRELPSLICDRCGGSLATPVGYPSDSGYRDARIRLSQVISGILTGQIEWVEEDRRLAAFRQRAAQSIRTRSGIAGDNLARHLNRVFGPDFLKLLHLSTDQAPTVGWPVLLLYGHNGMCDPIANSLIIAGLFDSAADYCVAVDAVPGEDLCRYREPNEFLSTGQITVPILRDALRSRTLRETKSDTQLSSWQPRYCGRSVIRRSGFLRIYSRHRPGYACRRQTNCRARRWRRPTGSV